MTEVDRVIAPEMIQAGDYQVSAGEAIEWLKGNIVDKRCDRINEIIENRTYTVATVIEGLFNTGNINAVMRSAEAFGMPALHIIDHAGDYKKSERTSKGAEKWLDVHHWNNAVSCVKRLKSQGYKIITMELAENAVPIGDIDFTQPTAIVLGNEYKGITPEMHELADHACIIPMDGFMESFNISVAAALSFYHAREDRIRRQGFHGDLNESEKERLKAHYYLRTVKTGLGILEHKASQNALGIK